MQPDKHRARAEDTESRAHTYKHKQTDIHAGNCSTTAPLASPPAMKNLEIKTNLLFIPSRSKRQAST